MIIKQTRIPTGSAHHAVNHVLDDSDNDVCEVLHGDLEMLEALAEARASTFGRKYCLRHVVLSPDTLLTRKQASKLQNHLFEEFGVADREHATVVHRKERSDATSSPHLHILITECDKQGKVLDSRMTMKRNEKLARLAEIEFGHNLTVGRHNRAVAHYLETCGHDHAAQVEQLADQPRPKAQFTSRQHQAAKRAGIPLPKIAQELRTVLDADDTTKLLSLIDVADQYGLRFTPGENDQTIMLVDTQHRKIASVSRLVRMQILDRDNVLQQLLAPQVDSLPFTA